MVKPDPITRLVQACDPRVALQPDDPRYVNCDEVRGENLAKHIERAIRMADPLRPEVKLFAGHRGVGKTTELLRLKAMLEEKQTNSPPFKVVYFDVSENLDVNDLDFPDLLVFAAAQVQQQLKAARIPGFSATSVYLNRVWDDIKGGLQSEVAISGANVDTGLASLAVEIRNRPNQRSSLRRAVEQQSTSLLGAVNDLLKEATARLRQAGYAGVVLIIDGLDKVVRRALDDNTNTHDRLFIHRRDQLASLDAHTVYTVPISLYYSPLTAQLEQTVGEFNVPMPMISLRGANRAKPTPKTPGMKKMWEMIESRCRHAGVQARDVFDDAKTAHYLCNMSGGHPRHLMMFIRAAALEVDALPITRKAAEQAVQNYANSLVREVQDEFWPKLVRFDRPKDDIPKDDDHQQMLLLLHVFEYMNDAPWYEVNPVLRTLHKFHERKRH